MTSRKRLSRTEALAAAAYSILSVRGQTENPTLNQISLAVVQVAPLLDITSDPEAPNLMSITIKKLIDDNDWNIDPVVLFMSSFMRNGRHHTNENRPRNDDGLPQEAGR